MPLREKDLDSTGRASYHHRLVYAGSVITIKRKAPPAAGKKHTAAATFENIIRERA
jgi:hypothetical protein